MPLQGSRAVRTAPCEGDRSPPTSRGAVARGTLFALVGGVLLLGTLGVLGLRRSPEQLRPPDTRVPRTAGASTAPALDDFVGARACAECHREQYDPWQRSTHGRAGGLPSPEVVVAPFDGVAIRFRDALVTPAVSADGTYSFTVERPGRPPVVFRVDGVVGGGHMVGGGTQGFVSRYPDGTVRFLPFDFATREGVWFCNTANIEGWWAAGANRPGTRTDRGFVPITEEMSIAECGDWPPIRTLGTNLRFQNCQQCHGSQIDIRFDPGALRYITDYMTLAVNCESCHGPGREHVERASEGFPGDPTRLGLPSLDTLATDGSLGVCFQCHAVKHPLETGLVTADNLERLYSLKIPHLVDEPFLPDGRVRTFAYQQNHLYSACYFGGSMTCVDCHEPHGQGYRDVARGNLVGRFDDGQCLGCHGSKAEGIEAHTFHPPASEGSRCVACHMPYIQQPAVGDGIAYARSDHTIAIPRPSFESGLGIRGACQGCHQDTGPDELDRQVAERWGELAPRHPLVQGLLDARSVQDPLLGAQLLLRPDQEHAVAQVAALDLFSARFVRPGAPVPGSALEALEGLADSRDPDVRALALATRLTVADESDVPDLLAREGVVDDLRSRVVAGLRLMGDDRVERGELADALAVYRRALAVAPDHPGVLSDLALAHSYRGDHPAALEHYARSLEMDPQQPEVWVNLGVTLENLGRADEAIEAFRTAVRYNPGEALAHFNLANVHFVRGEYEAAIDGYRLAVGHSPAMATGHLMLAQSYLLVGEADSALVSVRNALEFDPESEPARRMLADLLAGAGRR